MSRSFYKVTKGLAQVITTGEPVFVTDINGDIATVTRPIATTTGIEYRDETFPLDHLETRFEMAKRGVELEQFVGELREKAANKRFTMPAQIKAAMDQVSVQAQSYRDTTAKDN